MNIATWARLRPHSIRRFIDRGQLKAIRVGIVFRLTSEDVSAFVGKQIRAEDIASANNLILVSLDEMQDVKLK